MANYDNSANVAMDILIKHIKNAMEERGVSFYRLSKLTGIPEGTLSQNFNRKTEISLINFLKICGALELRPYLIPAEIDDNDFKRMFFN
ncbi:helix-turn-helix domain-containing protein [Mesonia aquimarina]|uniref:helix-turn-helix domain-containing protein n=1 Tax=Mesonia aquimarina TaxID=1504967 RepID=UPI000EF5B717|nr:helix-turn-helix transcriptional regulator [Mesonia aquimarina]